MPDQIDELYIKVSADTKSAAAGLDKIASRVEKIQNASNKQGGNALASTLSSITKATSKIAAGTGTKLDKLAEGLTALKSVGTIKLQISSTFAKRITEINKALQNLDTAAVNKLYKLAQASAALKSMGKLSLSGVTGEGEKETPAVSDSSARKSVSNINRIKTAFKNLKTGAKESFGFITKTLKGLGRRFMLRVVTRLFNAIISAIGNAIKNGVNAVYRWSQDLGEGFSKSMDKIATAGKYLSASLGAMLAPVINMLAPVIDELVDKFVELVNLVNRTMSALSGSDHWIEAIKTSVEYGDSLDDAAKSAKKLKEATMGFDKLNIISTKSKDDPMAGYEFREVQFKEGEAQDLLDGLNKVLEVAKLIGLAIAGWKIASAIAPLLQLTGIKELKFAVAIALAITSITLTYESHQKMLKGNATGEDVLKFIGGFLGSLATGGLIASTFKLGPYGVIIGLAIEGITIGASGLQNALEKGISLDSANAMAGGWGPIGTFISLIMMVVDAVKLIGSAFAEVKKTGKEIFGGLWQDIQEIFKDPFGFFKKKFDAVLKFFGDLWSDITTGGTTAWDDIEDAWKGASKWFDERFIQPLEKLFAPLAGWFETNVIQPIRKSFVGDIFDVAVDCLLKIFDYARDTIEIFNRLGQSGFEIMSAIISGRWDELGTIIQNSWARMNAPLPSQTNPTANPFRTHEVVKDLSTNAARNEKFLANQNTSRYVGGGSFANNTYSATDIDEYALVQCVKEGVVEAIKDTKSDKTEVTVNIDGKQVTSAVEKRQREQGKSIYSGGVMYVI